MSYVKSTLDADEKILFIGKYHWLVSLKALIRILIYVTLAVAALYYLPKLNTGWGWLVMVARVMAAMIVLFGAAKLLKTMVRVMTTEIAVTSQRLVFRSGLIARNIESVNVHKVESTIIQQSILGRMLDYGKIEVRGTGINEIELSEIANPNDLRRELDHASSCPAPAEAATGEEG